MSLDAICGCGRHSVPIGDKKIIYYEDKWWTTRCLFYKVDKRMPRITQKFEAMKKQVAEARKMKLKFTDMKNFIKKIPCAFCGNTCGNRFKIIGNVVCCGKCNYEMEM